MSARSLAAAVDNATIAMGKLMNTMPDSVGKICYRAVIQTKKPGGGVFTTYGRPHLSKGPAKGAVTRYRKRNPTTFLDGWVEFSETWGVLDD